MDTTKFDVILDASDENFAADLTKALGLQPGETINIMTPQFKRTDGRIVTYLPNTPEEYAALPKLDPVSLKKIGCQLWDDGHWLYPHEWYDSIPDGTEIVDINGDKELFVKGETDDDMRFGALSFGFLQTSH